MPHPDDVALGARIKQVRKLARISQTVVARESGITYQQLQKYERGENGVRYSRLREISEALGMDVIALIEPLVRPK
ncbi:MAG TPA: helix-turn-helix transcriptional regulator [Acidobacteriaceae bacterium]